MIVCQFSLSPVELDLPMGRRRGNWKTDSKYKYKRLAANRQRCPKGMYIRKYGQLAGIACVTSKKKARRIPCSDQVRNSARCKRKGY
jgi:hypothetical protein